ncbi:UDP-N-acetylmuramoyl-L-alanyl-D-glutamate--2,6-diaminopimelate ligase [Rufibacter glacialis]|uniref:UDP-N-acetylmuramoyl-L-alanyl-D-glutamate--2,6-diaminopimelate ligase n=1 Tax=Rufibacter glacialis TaxID=1259555 RepID=A0A5M8QCV8_9BACT|nr:UDP-N-acetylmuramoyl-L-alanyl-D-glutamate--2,6-diaminopimelate ligase [Rufibacter glacialis]KAA6432292.1 UDP-N-acetylmuramoyl-L-alanyl-D-glutamate--2,6-diaminopimelate ligase [Rufibacter glacialis]GGK77481.1 UDP-N-acetylmuramoyl-L-alanyl-D-glutamate--2,6-diaminopimelate ligase [Rufibacter glacialis]
MAQLENLLQVLQSPQLLGPTNPELSALTMDSRQAGPGVGFFAIRGTLRDGHDFIASAVEQGVSAVFCEELPQNTPAHVTFVQVPNAAEAMGHVAAEFYGNPSKKLKLVGVTGTNGKTTCVTLLHKLYRDLGYNAGLLSTVQNQINETVIPASHTTPDAITLQGLLAQMVKAGCTHAFMEVSSHALVQHRVTGVQFTGAVFTNISHDHLDYHGTFDEYIKAKKLFFDHLGKKAFALVNSDDKRAMVMLQNTKAAKYTYALRKEADFKARLLDNSIQGLQLELEGQEVWFRLIGTFNAYNLLAVYGAATLLGEDKQEVLASLSSLTSAAGRFDYVVSAGQITGIVDYAHTPDALENVLQTIQQIRRPDQKVITIVGCGGNRDATKRPVMADIAAKMSDRVILTSDNPRDEDPQEILNQMQAGVKATDLKKALSVIDRREAIKTAVLLAEADDIILVAGKGHETYQEVKGVRAPFDDKQVLQESFALLQK